MSPSAALHLLTIDIEYYGLVVNLITNRIKGSYSTETRWIKYDLQL